MFNISIPNKEKIAFLGNWSKSTVTEDNFDKIIDAFEAGIKFANDYGDKYTKRIFSENLLFAIESAEILSTSICKETQKHINVYLRIRNIESFEFLFTLPPDYFSKKENKEFLYNSTFDLRKKLNSETFKIDFIFTDDFGIDEDAIINDGFKHKYKAEIKPHDQSN